MPFVVHQLAGASPMHGRRADANTNSRAGKAIWKNQGQHVMGGYAAVSANCSSMKCPPVESGPVYCTELPNVQENMLPPCPAGTTPVAPSSCSSSLLSYCTRPSCGPSLLLHGSLYSVQPPPPLPFPPYLSPPTPSCVEASPT